MPIQPSEEDIDGSHGDILPYVVVELLEPIECAEFAHAAVCLLPGSQGTVLDQYPNGIVCVEFSDCLMQHADPDAMENFDDGSVALQWLHVSKLRRLNV